MRDAVKRSGTPDLPTARAAETALADACSETVIGVEWCARRRLPPDDLDVVVYRGIVDRSEREERADYYVVLGAGTTRVFPARGFDSLIGLVVAFQAYRRDESVVRD